MEPGTRGIQFQVTYKTALVSHVAQISLAVAFGIEGITINGTRGDVTVFGGVGENFLDGKSGDDILQINASQNTTINLGESNYEDMNDPINNIEAIDLTGGDVNITLGLAADDDNELDITIGDGKEVDLRDGDQAVEGTDDDGSTRFTHFDDERNILAKISICDDTDNTCT